MLAPPPAKSSRHGSRLGPRPALAWLAPLPLAAWLLAEAPAVRGEDRLAWHGAGVWLAGDTHVHEMLDPERGPELVDAAKRFDLDFIASTEHSEQAFDERTVERLRALRQRHPRLLVLAGVEWNVPSGDHASVIVEQEPQEIELLRTFARSYDRKVNAELVRQRPTQDDGSWGRLDDAVGGLRWLADQERRGGPAAVVYLNHLCRNGYFEPVEIAALLDAGLSGIEAAHGHQKRRHPGEACTLDRHDPFVLVGNGLDWLADTGRQVGLSAGSDFHNEKYSYLPGEFSRTLVYAPERTSSGVIRGLAAGATVTVLGGIVDHADVAVGVGPAEEASVGETLVVPVGSAARVTLRVRVPKRDALDQPNRVDRIEVISNCYGPASRIWISEVVPPGTARFDVDLPKDALSRPGQFYVRVAGRRFVGGAGHDAEDADFQFHVSPIQVRVVAPPAGARLGAVAWPWG